MDVVGHMWLLDFLFHVIFISLPRDLCCDSVFHTKHAGRRLMSSISVHSQTGLVEFNCGCGVIIEQRVWLISADGLSKHKRAESRFCLTEGSCTQITSLPESKERNQVHNCTCDTKRKHTPPVDGELLVVPQSAFIWVSFVSYWLGCSRHCQSTLFTFSSAAH